MTKLYMFVALVVALVIIGPLMTIWALNVLFPSLAIPYTLETWAAVAIIHSILQAKISKK